MHGVPSAIRGAFPKRITSVAEEPSFLAPLLIEFIILSFFLINTKWLKYIIVGCTSALILLTFSGGAYANSILVSLFALFLMLWRYPFGKLHVSVIVLISLSIFFFATYGQLLLEFAVSKFLHEASGGSSRAQFMGDLVSLISRADWGNLFIGHGLTSLSYLDVFGMQHEDMLFRISNNMFIDVLFESGIIGVLIAIFIYIHMFNHGFKIQCRKVRGLSLSVLLVFQSLITSFYRSEYISSHMIWVLLVIFWALRYERNQVDLIQMNAPQNRKLK